MVSEVFTNMARCNSEGAWKLLIEEQDPFLRRGMATGIILGLPDGQDWKAVVKEIEDLQMDLFFSMHRPLILSRWFLENPDAVLNWLDEERKLIEPRLTAALDSVKSSNASEERDEVEDQIVQWNESLDLLDEKEVFHYLLGQFGKAGQEAFSSWMEEKLVEGNGRREELLAELLFVDMRWERDPFCADEDSITELVGTRPVFPDGESVLEVNDAGLPFLSLIEHLPEENARKYFLTFVELIQPRVASVDDPFKDYTWTFERPNFALDAARELIFKVPLTETERELAEAAFARVEAEEERNRRE